ncbi:MAG: hypothetical protein EBV69_10025 [Oxalobacteraceae bacterium]|nr:hypothetical protein [Oxalobacteraceae bacterium]
MSLRPLHDRVIVERQEQETKTASGIVLLIRNVLRMTAFESDGLVIHLPLKHPDDGVELPNPLNISRSKHHGS